jgi:hypothetical protein
MSEFANPQAPSNYKHPANSNRDNDDGSGQALTNADFRKLLMTPSASSGKEKQSSSASTSSTSKTESLK